MAARLMFLLLLVLVAAGCLQISQVIIVLSEPVPTGMPIQIPQLIIIEPDMQPPFVPDFSLIVTVTPDYPFFTPIPVVTLPIPFSTLTPRPIITPSNLPPLGGG